MAADFLTVAGILVPVLTDGAERGEPELIGEVERMADGSLKSTVQGYKHAWRCTVGPLTEADANALEAAIGFGMTTVAGRLVGTLTPFSANVRVASRRPIEAASDPTGALWELALDIRQA
ncbi:MAG TPA: hypothetical protein VFS08_09965 [Gemmatimonadaceae bacterium]|nr:hypothetical protein [Gemmatimonadaceae bacterium]